MSYPQVINKLWIILRKPKEKKVQELLDLEGFIEYN